MVCPPTIITVKAGAFANHNPSPASFLVENRKEPIWYLAYGSNLSSVVFKGRRGINPFQAKNVYAKGVELAFDLPGLPYLEPRFANCRLAQGVEANDYYKDTERDKLLKAGSQRVDDHEWSGCLIGVAYLVSPEDFATILKTEGGGSAYEVIFVDARVLDPAGDCLQFTGEILETCTLSAPSSLTRPTIGQPSLRYLDLIRNGAREHKLPNSYIEYLDRLPHYSATSFRQKTGRALFIAVWAPLFLVVTILSILTADLTGRFADWVLRLRQRISKDMWSAYDGLWRPAFGDGEKREDGDVLANVSAMARPLTVLCLLLVLKFARSL